MTEDELKVVQKYSSRLKADTQNEESLQRLHSIDKTKQMHRLRRILKMM